MLSSTPRRPRTHYIFTTISVNISPGGRDRHRRPGNSRGTFSRLCARIPGVWCCSRSSRKWRKLLADGTHAPFSLAVGIGRAGERVAQQLQACTGWFPKISRVDITREEDGHGGYNVVATTGIPLAQQLPPLDAVSSMAVVDDTVFSGLTMRTVLLALPEEVRARTQAFCLRGVAASLADISALCPIAIGFAAPGRLLDEVSFINASGLVMRVGIRHPDQPPQAFFERPRWMHAWFPGYADEVIALCQRLNTHPGTRRPAGSVPLRS